MNNYIPSGASLFDVLSMIVPGCLILYLIGPLLGVDGASCKSGELVFSIVVIMFSYLIGLVWNMFMDKVFIGFRNDPTSICIAKKKYYDKVTCDRICFHKFNVLFNIICFKKATDSIIEDYNNAYYKVVRNSIGNVIIILETQVAFIRNTILLILAYGLLIYCGYCDLSLIGIGCLNKPELVGLSLVLTSILMFCAMISRQQKIYDRVWEELYYNEERQASNSK